METLDPKVVAWVLAHGRDHVDDAATMLATGDDALRVATRLRATLTSERAAFVLSAAVARGKAVAAGVPGAERLILTREAQEQASHPSVAAWRAARAAASMDDRLARPLQDRCSGTGGDAVAMAAHAPVTAVEHDEGRALLARDRATVLGVDVEVLVADAVGPDVDATATIVHVDPDRRDAQGRRARTLAQHRPSVAAIRAATSDARGRMVTVAPGVAWSDPDLSADGASGEVVFLQLHGRLVEAVLCDGAAAASDVRARAVLLPEGLEATRVDEDDQLPVGAIGAYLLLPAVAATRARLQDQLGAPLGARRVARRRALLTCDDPAPSSPWFGVEPVLDVIPGRARALRDWLRSNPDRTVELVLHGVDVDPTRFLRAAGRPPTGPHDLRVHLVRRDQDTVSVVCGPSRHDR